MFLSKIIFLVKIEKTVENFEMSFLPVVDQKYRFSLPFLRGKMTFFSKKVKKCQLHFLKFFQNWYPVGGSRGSEQVINTKKQVRRLMEAGKTFFGGGIIYIFLTYCWVDNSVKLNPNHFSLDAFDSSESRVFTPKFSFKIIF